MNVLILAVCSMMLGGNLAYILAAHAYGFETRPEVVISMAAVSVACAVISWLIND